MYLFYSNFNSKIDFTFVWFNGGSESTLYLVVPFGQVYVCTRMNRWLGVRGVTRPSPIVTISHLAGLVFLRLEKLRI